MPNSDRRPAAVPSRHQVARRRWLQRNASTPAARRAAKKGGGR